jgi:hypothetical protein
MTISLANVKSGVSKSPPMSMVYGTHGVGKTSFAASAPAPIFLQTEDGLGLIDRPTFGLLRSFDEVMQAVGSLYSEDHKYQTLVLDSVDHLEPLVWAQVCKDNGWPNIETPGYGKGYVAALDMWRLLIDGLRALRDDRQMSIILIAHSQISRFEAPDSEPYDRYSPKIHKGASALLQEAMDNVLFANYRISTVKSDAGFGKKVTRAVGGGDRVLYTEERPAYLAKQRYNLEPIIPMDWEAYAAGVPYYSAITQQKKA